MSGSAGVGGKLQGPEVPRSCDGGGNGRPKVLHPVDMVPLDGLKPLRVSGLMGGGQCESGRVVIGIMVRRIGRGENSRHLYTYVQDANDDDDHNCCDPGKKKGGGAGSGWRVWSAATSFEGPVDPSQVLSLDFESPLCNTVDNHQEGDTETKSHSNCIANNN